MSWWNSNRCGSSPRERRRDTPPAITIAATAESRTGPGATQQSCVCKRDKSESESESTEVTALARFWQTERRGQNSNTEGVSNPQKPL